MASADRVVAVCEWVRDVLLRNDVPEAKIVLNRQGLARIQENPVSSAPESVARGPFHLAYFGRIDATKGLDVLIRAVRAAPGLELVLEVHGVIQPGGEGLAAELRSLASGDTRIRFLEPVAPGGVVAAMRKYDAIAVPSQWLETGPLVVLEAFAAGVPILGSRRGGIAELVSEGVDGVLVEAGSVADWTSALTRLANDRGLLNSLRSRVRPPRSMEDVAREMAATYAHLPAANAAAHAEHAN
jgi:glycosyltransferase involved in cell wall biosynthesis